MKIDWDEVVLKAERGDKAAQRLLTAVFGPPSEEIAAKYALYDAQNAVQEPLGSTQVPSEV
jgi:hypothetical protein